MSVEESDRNKGNARGGQEEEEWLYGDVDEEKAEETSPGSATAGSAAKEVHENGVETEEPGQNDKDSDNDSDNDSDDDDICVTIGDIKSGGSSHYTGFGSSPVNLNIKAEGRMHAVVGNKPKGVDMDSLGSIQGIPVLDVDVESLEEKPWRKPGADISDYFNYGFNEDTWKAYCEKQRRIRINNESTSSKIMVQQGRIGHGDKEARCDYASSGSLFRSRKSSGSIDVIGGQTGSISRMEGRRRHSNEGNNIQVLSEASSDGDSSANKICSFFPANIPPPPFLPPPSNVSSAPPLIPPPRFPLPPGVPPPPSLISTLDSGRSGGHDGPPIPPYPFPPGVYPLLPGSMASWAGVMESAKAWEYYARQDRGREKGRDRSRERGHDKDRERGRDREREHSPSSQALNSEEERQRHREQGERGYERHRDRSSREREERHREWRRRDKDEGRHRHTRSSKRQRRDSEEGDGHRRHKHKRAKRSREDKETSHELSGDQENQSDPNE